MGLTLLFSEIGLERLGDGITLHVCGVGEVYKIEVYLVNCFTLGITAYLVVNIWAVLM